MLVSGIADHCQLIGTMGRVEAQYPAKANRASEPSSFSVRSPRRCWGREHTIAMGEDINTG